MSGDGEAIHRTGSRADVPKELGVRPALSIGHKKVFLVIALIMGKAPI